MVSQKPARDSSIELSTTVVDDLVDQVVQPALPLVADVHAGAFADRFEPFEYVYVLFVVVGGEIAVLRVYRKFHVCHL